MNRTLNNEGHGFEIIKLKTLYYSDIGMLMFIAAQLMVKILEVSSMSVNR